MRRKNFNKSLNSVKSYMYHSIIFSNNYTHPFIPSLEGILLRFKKSIVPSLEGRGVGKTLLFILCTIFIIFPSNAQSLDEYLKIAAENNPGLKAKFFSYQASLEKVPQVGALPDPQLSFGIFIEPMERYMGNQIADISLMQMFPWFGTLSAAEDEAVAMAKARYEEFNEAKTMLFYEVKAIWYSLHLLRKEISIAEENIEILKTLEEIAITRLKSGSTGGSSGSSSGGMQSERSRPESIRDPSEMPSGKDKSSGTSSTSGMSGMNMQNQTTPGSTTQAQDMSGMNSMSSDGNMVNVLRVQLEINELKNKLALLYDSKQPLLVQFNKLLNRSADEYVNIPDAISASSLPASIFEIPDSIRLNNPMLQMLQREEESHLAHERMNKKMGFPMIGLGLQYSIFQQRPESMMTAKNMIMPMVTISLPIWRSKYDASVKEAEFLRHSTGKRKEETENQLLVSYEEALKDFKDAERRIELYEQQTQLAQQALNILTIQYTTAGSNFEEVLRMQQQLLDYRLRSLAAVVDQNIAAAMIERLMGR
jgi:outer membrane protein TolC